MSEGSKSYLRSVSGVLLGAIAAQAIPLAVMPVLTRLVGPEDLGLYSAWLGLVFVIAILASGRAEVLIVVTGSDQGQRNCYAYALYCATLVSLLAGLLALALQTSLTQWIPGWTASAAFGLAAGIWSLALSQVWRGYASVAGQFMTLSWIRVAAAGLTALLQVVGAWFNAGSDGLLWGYVLGLAGSVWVARWLMGQPLRQGTVRPDAPLLGRYLGDNRKILLYAMPADLINNICQQLPTLLIASRFGAEMAGFYALTVRTLDAPAAVFSTSVLDVYKRRATQEFEATGQCRRAFIETLKLLFLAAIAPAIVVLVLGPWLFATIFGDQWRESGLIAVALVPMMFLRFFASPLGYTLYIAKHANQQLMWQIGLLLCTLGVFLSPLAVFDAIVAYSAAYSAMYVIYLAISYRAAINRDMEPGQARNTGTLDVTKPD